MSAGRPNKPLFELLRDGPEPSDDQPAGHAPPDAPRARSGARSVQVPVSTLAIGGALVLGLVLLAWVGGHKFGLEEGRREMSGVSTPDALSGLVIDDPTAGSGTRPSAPGPDEAARGHSNAW